jgi:hypothetical protein
MIRIAHATIEKILRLQPLPKNPLFSTAFTALSITIIPSPMMMRVRRLIRSTRCVLLKLTTFHFDEADITPTTSRKITAYLEPNVSY